MRGAIGTADGLIELRVLIPEQPPSDLGKLLKSLVEALRTTHRTGLTLDFAGVQKIDTALLLSLRLLAQEARKLKRPLTFSNVPAGLRYALSGTSFLLQWTRGLLPVEADSAAGQHILHGCCSVAPAAQVR